MEELEQAYDKMCEGFHEFDSLLKQMDRQMWERWKAGGKDITGEFVSMYPSAGECLERLQEELQEEPDK